MGLLGEFARERRREIGMRDDFSLVGGLNFATYFLLVYGNMDIVRLSEMYFVGKLHLIWAIV